MNIAPLCRIVASGLLLSLMLNAEARSESPWESPLLTQASSGMHHHQTPRNSPWLHKTQSGEIMTATGANSSRAAACDQAINQAKTLCYLRELRDIFNVKCECAEDTTLGQWECVAAVACQ